MSIKPERDCKYIDWIFIQHYHIREYLVGFWWGSANSKRNHRGRRSTKIKRTDHQMLFDTGNKRNHITGQLADNLQMPIKKTHITEQLAENLQLPNNASETLTVNMFSASKPRQLQTPVTELMLLMKDGSSLQSRVNVVPKKWLVLCREHVLTPRKSNTLLRALFSLTKAPLRMKQLIGNEYYHEILSGNEQMKHVFPGLTLMGSKFGWILAGRVKYQDAPSANSVPILAYTSIH